MSKKVFLLAAILSAVLVLATNVKADTIIASQTNNYAFGADPNAVSIASTVFSQGADYLWQYVVTNNSYDPVPGSSNGFSGFELSLPGGFPADLANVTDPSAGWEHNCCSGLAEEWDIDNATGFGVTPGHVGTFTFTTLPRSITTATAGWFHTWQNNVQTDLVFYGADNAPLAPNLLLPPTPIGTPEPGVLSLLGIGGLGLAFMRRFRTKLR